MTTPEDKEEAKKEVKGGIEAFLDQWGINSLEKQWDRINIDPIDYQIAKCKEELLFIRNLQNLSMERTRVAAIRVRSLLNINCFDNIDGLNFFEETERIVSPSQPQPLHYMGTTNEERQSLINNYYANVQEFLANFAEFKNLEKAANNVIEKLHSYEVKKENLLKQKHRLFLVPRKILSYSFYGMTFTAFFLNFIWPDLLSFITTIFTSIVDLIELVKVLIPLSHR